MQAGRFAAVAGLSLLLGACASAGGPRHVAQSSAYDDYDADKVAAVNLWAETKGATVIWINYPTRRRPSDE